MRLIFLVMATLSINIAAGANIVRIPYKPNTIVPLRCTPFYTTQILLSRDEVIQTIETGDLAAWSVDVPKLSPFMAFIKPNVTSSQTNLTLVTNRHSYYFDLTTQTDKPTEQLSYALVFTYPEQHTTNQPGKHKKALPNRNYSFYGDKQLLPKAVYDDGTFTYFHFSNRDLPAIFKIDNPYGREELVNYHRQGDWLVVKTIAPQFTLREGRYHVLSLFNNTLIAKLKNRSTKQRVKK